MPTGCDLASIHAMHQLKAVSKKKVQKGGESLLRQFVGTSENLNVAVLGVQYPVFVFGVDNPDDADTDRWIP